MLGAAQSAQNSGDERLEEQAEEDDQDKCQCIFHNLKLLFPFVSGLPAPGMRIFFFPVEIQIKMSLDYIG